MEEELRRAGQLQEGRAEVRRLQTQVEELFSTRQALAQQLRDLLGKVGLLTLTVQALAIRVWLKPIDAQHLIFCTFQVIVCLHVCVVRCGVIVGFPARASAVVGWVWWALPATAGEQDARRQGIADWHARVSVCVCGSAGRPVPFSWAQSGGNYHPNTAPCLLDTPTTPTTPHVLMVMW